MSNWRDIKPSAKIYKIPESTNVIVMEFLDDGKYQTKIIPVKNELGMVIGQKSISVVDFEVKDVSSQEVGTFSTGSKRLLSELAKFDSLIGKIIKITRNAISKYDMDATFEAIEV